MTETGHVHHWKRWPVINFTISYACTVCEEPEDVIWTDWAGKTIADADRYVTGKRGGVFAGEMVPQPTPMARRSVMSSGPHSGATWPATLKREVVVPR